MKRLSLILLSLPLLSGCAGFGTTQTDRSYDPTTGKLIREIRTRAASRTFFESNSKLTNWKATQTDKSQSASVGALNQEASATNLVRLVEVGADGLSKGAVRYLVPIR